MVVVVGEEVGFVVVVVVDSETKSMDKIWGFFAWILQEGEIDL